MFVPSLANALLGGWKVEGPVTEEAREIFNQAMGALVGVDYVPLLYARQTVKGVNYCFICSYAVVAPHAPEGYASIFIYVPLDSEPTVTSIKRII